MHIFIRKLLLENLSFSCKTVLFVYKTFKYICTLYSIPIRIRQEILAQNDLGAMTGVSKNLLT